MRVSICAKLRTGPKARASKSESPFNPGMTLCCGSGRPAIPPSVEYAWRLSADSDGNSSHRNVPAFRPRSYLAPPKSLPTSPIPSFFTKKSKEGTSHESWTRKERALDAHDERPCSRSPSLFHIFTFSVQLTLPTGTLASTLPSPVTTFFCPPYLYLPRPRLYWCDCERGRIRSTS